MEKLHFEVRRNFKFSTFEKSQFFVHDSSLDWPNWIQPTPRGQPHGNRPLGFGIFQIGPFSVPFSPKNPPKKCHFRLFWPFLQYSKCSKSTFLFRYCFEILHRPQAVIDLTLLKKSAWYLKNKVEKRQKKGQKLVFFSHFLTQREPLNNSKALLLQALLPQRPIYRSKKQ